MVQSLLLISVIAYILETVISGKISITKFIFYCYILYFFHKIIFFKFGNEDYKYENVSVCDRNVIFVVGGGPYVHIYKAVYDESKNKYDFSIFVYRYNLALRQISCASHDKSFWFVPVWSQDYDYRA
jgi:hypothetical protein